MTLQNEILRTGKSTVPPDSDFLVSGLYIKIPAVLHFDFSPYSPITVIAIPTYIHPFCIKLDTSEAFKRLDFPDPPSISNYVRYDVEDFGDITEFSVSLWIREYEDQELNMRFIFSYSSEGTGKDNEILIGRDVEADLMSLCIAGTCNRQGNMIGKSIP